jgi:hypothetical protein
MLRFYDSLFGTITKSGYLGAYMAKAKTTQQSDSSTHEASAGNGQLKEKLTNKAEALRRALAQLGSKAKPATIQGFVKTHFGVEMTTTVISVYKSQLLKRGGMQAKAGRRPKEAGVVMEPPSKRAIHEAVSLKDLRTVKEISNRLGAARMRELVELMVD